MKYHIIVASVILMLIGLLLSRCSKEHLDNAPNILWRTSVTVKQTFGSFTPMIVGNKVAINVDSSNHGTSTPVFIFDKNTGKLLHQWADFFEPTKDIIGDQNKYHYDNKIFFGTRNKVFSVDINTGNTLFKYWDKNYISAYWEVTGLENKMYKHLNNGLYDNDSEDCIKEYNTITGEQRIIYSAKGKDNYQVGLRYPILYIDQSKDTILLVTNMMYNFTTRNNKRFFVKYNVTKKQILFEKEWYYNENEGGSLSSPPLIHKGKAYITLGSKIMCVDLETGEMLWTRLLKSIVAFSDPIIAQNTFYVIDEDRQLYALDLNTGNILWQTEGSGSSSNLAYLNGVLYFTGGGDGLLHAVEASNGQHIYKFRCPDEAINSNFWWQRGVTVDPETKRLYVASYGSLFCLTAVR